MASLPPYHLQSRLQPHSNLKYAEAGNSCAYLQLTVLQVIDRKAAGADVLVDVLDAPRLIHNIIQRPILAQLHQDGQGDILRRRVEPSGSQNRIVAPKVDCKSA